MVALRTRAGGEMAAAEAVPEPRELTVEEQGVLRDVFAKFDEVRGAVRGAEPRNLDFVVLGCSALQPKNKIHVREKLVQSGRFVHSVPLFAPRPDGAQRSVACFAPQDNGGSIDEEELGHAMKALGAQVSAEELKELVQEIDEDGNGEIDFDE